MAWRWRWQWGWRTSAAASVGNIEGRPALAELVESLGLGGLNEVRDELASPGRDDFRIGMLRRLDAIELGQVRRHDREFLTGSQLLLES